MFTLISKTGMGLLKKGVRFTVPVYEGITWEERNLVT